MLMGLSKNRQILGSVAVVGMAVLLIAAAAG